MKITKTANKAMLEDHRREVANAGCYKCPCCGEEHTFSFYARQGIFNRGILDGIYRVTSTGIFHFKHFRIDCYHCLTCDAQWESEPYEY